MLDLSTAMVESYMCDWTTLDASRTTRTSLSAQHDVRWTAVQTLAPFEELALQSQARHDVYVLQGSVLDSVARGSGHETWARDELDWWGGSVHGMKIAPLSKLHHRLSLVRLQPVTRADMHTHPFGEEIFVLSSELRDECGAYPAGSWTRFHPGSRHAPYAERDTMILLRNGHLSS